MSSVPSGSVMTEEDKKAERWREAKKALRKFWIGGMAAACFSGIAHSIPIDLRARGHDLQSIDWHYTMDVFLRYFYMTWFMVYFFVTSFDTDQVKKEGDRGREPHAQREIWYDVLQSILATVAVYRLAPGADGTTHHALSDFFFANCTILFISLLAWVLFRDDKTANIQDLRLSAAGVAALSLALIWAFPASLALSVTLLILLIGLGLLLGVYAYRRIKEPSGSQTAPSPSAIPC